jgi:hypothetical protein
MYHFRGILVYQKLFILKPNKKDEIRGGYVRGHGYQVIRD